MRIDHSVFIRFCLTAMMAFSVAVAGCGSSGTNGTDGMDGQDGTDGTDGTDGMDGQDGKPGGVPPGPGDVVDISNPLNEALLVAFGEPLVAEITGVTVASPPVVSFTIQTQGGADVTGVAPASISGTFDKLVAAADGKRSHWVSYIHGQETGDKPKTCKLGDEAGNLCSDDDDCPGGTCTDDAPAVPDDPGARQAERDPGEDGSDPDNPISKVVDNGDGSYTFTYTTDPVTSTDPTWEPDLTHRAGLEIRIDGVLNPDNPTFDLVPSGGAGSGHKLIADTNLCNNCHGRLALHGEGRFTVEYCVTCHNDQSRDQGWGESIDMANMVHAIHAADLREVQGDFPYWILGRSPHDYTETTYPPPLVDCAACHTQSEDTPDGDAWKTSSDSLSCGGCHVAGLTVSMPDATTGLSTYSYTHQAVPEIGEQQDGTCATNCHAPGTDLSPGSIHVNHVAVEAQKYALRIDDVVLEGGLGGDWNGDAAITFTALVDGTAYDITTVDGPFDPLENARLRLRVAWSTDDYSNHDSGEDVGQPFTIDALVDCNATPAVNCVKNMDDSFTVSMSIEPPSITGDSIAVALEGRARADANGDGSLSNIPITSQIAYANADDVAADATPRRDIVDIALCNNCHGALSEHGSNRTNNIQVCAVCHNANATDEADDEASVDLKVMIHGIHSRNASFGDGGDTFFDITYPRHERLPNECNACHLEGTYYPVDTVADFRLATTTDSWLDPADPEDDVNTTFNAATCGGCHVRLDDPGTTADESAGNASTLAHFFQNGSGFDVTQSIEGELSPLTVETCTFCHASGGIADVEEAHGGE